MIKNDTRKILIIDVNGAKKIKELYPDRSILIFIYPPSLEILKERMIQRGENDITQINERIKMAEKEIKNKDLYDYFICNDNFELSCREVEKIILKIATEEKGGKE